MNLYQKIQTTVPGRHAVALGDVRYYHGHTIGKERQDALAAAEAYLEALAIEELRKSETWVTELAQRVTPPASGQEGSE